THARTHTHMIEVHTHIHTHTHTHTFLTPHGLHKGQERYLQPRQNIKRRHTSTHTHTHTHSSPPMACIKGKSDTFSLDQIENGDRCSTSMTSFSSSNLVLI